ncbi:hypothetical protein D9M72_437990 [compost metagenome]
MARWRDRGLPQHDGRPCARRAHGAAGQLPARVQPSLGSGAALLAAAAAAAGAGGGARPADRAAGRRPEPGAAEAADPRQDRRQPVLHGGSGPDPVRGRRAAGPARLLPHRAGACAAPYPHHGPGRAGRAYRPVAAGAERTAADAGGDRQGIPAKPGAEGGRAGGRQTASAAGRPAGCGFHPRTTGAP